MTQASDGGNPYTKGIATFVSGLSYEQIPPEVVQRMKLLVLDTLGCGIYGALPEHSRILIDTLGKLDTSVESAVWGTKQRLSPPHAALANGSMIQGFELDDVHSRGILHIGCGTL